MIPVENISDIIEQMSCGKLPETVNTSVIIRCYNEYCIKFNTAVAQCAKIAAGKNIAGVMSFIEDESLELRLTQLSVNCRNKADAYCRANSLPLLEVPDADKLNEIRTMCADFQNKFAPLVEMYRKVSRSGTLGEKATLLRRIVAVSDDREWVTVLRETEQLLLDDLSHRAKDAVIRKDYEELKKIRKKFDGKWLVKPKEFILQKIDKVLIDHHIEEVSSKVKQLTSEVNDAYSAFDVDALSAAFTEYDALMQNEQYYVPDDITQRQLDEAREYCTAQQKQRAGEREYERLIEELRNGLLNEAPPTFLQKTVNTVQSMGYIVPDELLRQFAAYSDSAEISARRKRMVKAVAGTVASVLVIAVIAYAAYSYVIANSERQWLARLEESYRKNSADETLKLVSDLEKSSPAVSRRPAILEMRHKIEHKKAEEDIKRKTFAEFAVKMKELLKNYAANRIQIADLKTKLIRNTVDQKERAQLESFEIEIDAERTSYEARERKMYHVKLAGFKQQYALFVSSLAQCDTEQALLAVSGMKKYKAEMEKINCNDPLLKRESNRFFRESANVEDMLAAFKDSLASENFDDFNFRTQAFIRLLTEPALAATGRGLLNSDLAIGSTLNTADSADTGKVPFFADDSERAVELVKAGLNARSKVLALIRKRMDVLNKNHVKHIVLRSKDGKLCNLLFYDKEKKDFQGVRSSQYRLNCLFDNSKTKIVMFYLNEQENIAKVTKKNPEIKFTGKIVYPVPMSFNAPMPIIYTKYYGMLETRLKAADQKTFAGDQQIIHDALAAALSDPALHPYLKGVLANDFMKMLTMYADGKPDADNTSWQNKLNAWHGKVCKTWYMTFGNASITNEEKELQKLPPASEISHYGEAELKALNAVLNRRIKPVGYIFCRGDAVEIKLFKGAPKSGEVWLSDAAGRFMLAGRYNGSRYTGEKLQLRMLKVIFSPIDNIDTAAFSAQIRNNLKKCRIPTALPLEYKAEL